jgi:hypothetical protein
MPDQRGNLAPAARLRMGRGLPPADPAASGPAPGAGRTIGTNSGALLTSESPTSN